MKKFIIAKKRGKNISYLQDNLPGTPAYTWVTNYNAATTLSIKNLAIAYIKTYCNEPKNNINLMILPITITIDRPIYNSERD